MRLTGKIAIMAVGMLLAGSLVQAGPPGEEPALGSQRITQDDILDGMSLKQIQAFGLRIFTTPFNKLDGHGDGPFDPADTITPGGRPTLGGNGTFLRVNGLDAQTCLDCHAVVSAATRPPTLGIGGVGTANNNAIIAPTEIDPADLLDLDGIAGFNGRLANPPFVFGAGGVELLAVEMTTDLQTLKAQALAAPGTVVKLTTKGVEFGSIVADSLGNLDTSAVKGVSDDLVVRPFGRKGEFTTMRAFDMGAMMFHFGMQPVEAVGEGIDGDEDGVVDEILVGEISALSVFIATLPRPQQDRLDDQGQAGFASFKTLGCAGCHIPALETISRKLPLRFPEVAEDQTANIFMNIDLTAPPVKFEKSGTGIRVPLFADLKRHDMGPGLAENFALADAQTNREFITARLWGIADSAPFLHDGRATTLTEAILAHGGEAQGSRDAYDALSDSEKIEVLEFLRTLRMPQPADGPPGLARGMTDPD